MKYIIKIIVLLFLSANAYSQTTFLKHFYNNNGHVGIGVPVPTGQIHFYRNTTTTPAIRFSLTGAAKLTTPLTGAFEAAPDGLWYTKPDGTRVRIDSLMGSGEISIATFNAGYGEADDTLLFSNTAIYGSFFNAGTDTLVVTGAKIIGSSTTDSLLIQIRFYPSIQATASLLFTGGYNFYNIGNTGVLVSSGFSTYKIPPNNYVYMVTPSVIDGRKPKMLSLTLIGYRKKV